MEVRTSTDDEGSPVIASANITDTKDDSGNLNLTITATNMNVSAGTYVYDLQATLSGVVTTWLYGTFTVNEDVTIT